MAKRGRPKLDKLDQITMDAAIRWVAEQKIKGGKRMAVVKYEIAKDSVTPYPADFIGPVIPKRKVTERQVRAAHERFGRMMKPKKKT